MRTEANEDFAPQLMSAARSIGVALFFFFFVCSLAACILTNSKDVPTSPNLNTLWVQEGAVKACTLRKAIHGP